MYLEGTPTLYVRIFFCALVLYLYAKMVRGGYHKDDRKNYFLIHAVSYASRIVNLILMIIIFGLNSGIIIYPTIFAVEFGYYLYLIFRFWKLNQAYFLTFPIPGLDDEKHGVRNVYLQPPTTI